MTIDRPATRSYTEERRHGLLDELEQALATGALELRYQPQLDLATRRVAGFEALLRWDHPRLGLVRPSSFIGVLERSPLLAPVTASVVDQALAACARWQRMGFALDVTVNVSAPSLLDTRLVDDVSSALARHGLAGSSLVVEVTETMPLIDLDRGAQVLDRLCHLGVRVALDDFGAGHCGLRELHRLPVDEIKLDRSFVACMVADPTAEAIVRGTCDLARELGVRVVGEGVECEGDVAALHAAGCDRAQGVAISPPVADADVVAAIRRIELGRAAAAASATAGALLRTRSTSGRHPSSDGWRAFPAL